MKPRGARVALEFGSMLRPIVELNGKGTGSAIRIFLALKES